MGDQKKGRSKSLVVVTGSGVLPQDIAEDPFEVAKGLVNKVTGLILEKYEVKTCHRTETNGANFLFVFLFMGPGSKLIKIIKPQHKAQS